MLSQGISFGMNRAGFAIHQEWNLPAGEDGVTPAVDEMVAFIARTGIVAGHESAIELALQEAVSNAVVHGCDGDASKTVHCWIGCDPVTGVVMVIRDPGPGFDITTPPDPLGDAGLMADHGRGLYLIRSLMDDVCYERGGTELHMWKRPEAP